MEKKWGKKENEEPINNFLKREIKTVRQKFLNAKSARLNLASNIGEEYGRQTFLPGA